MLQGHLPFGIEIEDLLHNLGRLDYDLESNLMGSRAEAHFL